MDQELKQEEIAKPKPDPNQAKKDKRKERITDIALTSAAFFTGFIAVKLLIDRSQ